MSLIGSTLFFGISGVCGYMVGYIAGYGDAFRYVLEKDDKENPNVRP